MKALETYAEYLKRVSGLADFKALTQEGWEKEMSVSIGTVVDVDPNSNASSGQTLQNVWSQFIPAEEPEEDTFTETDQAMKNMIED